MNELANKNEILMAMTARELPAIAVESEIAIQNQSKIPLARIATLGAGLQPVATAIQQVANKGQATSGYYMVTIPPGTQLAKFRNEPGYLGTVLGEGGIAGQARLNPVLCDPTMLIVAAALANIDQKLDAIQEAQKEMMEFLSQKEKSELRGNLDFLHDVYNNYKHNWNSDKYKTANHIKALDIRQSSSQMIDFYREQIKSRAGKQNFLHGDHDVKKQLDRVQEDFKEYQLALYLYGFAYFLEVLLQENYDAAYLDAIAKKIEALSFQYRELYTETYSAIENYSKTSLQGRLLGGLSVANKVAGEAMAKIPVISKSQIDEGLVGIGEKLGAYNEKRVTVTMQQLVDKQSSCVQPFVENIVAINQLYNQPISLVFNSETLYISPSNEPSEEIGGSGD